MKEEGKLAVWWASLTVSEKERIASKVASKALGGKYVQVHYPECSALWNELPQEEQQAIYNHCTDAHGLLLQVWKNGNPFS